MTFGTPLLVRLWREEFEDYSRAHFQLDLVAGLTVAAVALPLALAFGVASGSTAAAGLVTAIVAGIVIGVLSGAPFQISGPTGAMSAVLIVIAQRHDPQGLWVAGLMAGLMILALGIFKLGRIINFIPAPVITGFTSGIALIIFIGQIDNALGISTPTEESTALKAIAYTHEPIPFEALNSQAIVCALIVIVAMVALPQVPRISRVPAALTGIMLVTGISWGFGWDVTTIGAIPRSIVLDERYTFHLDDLELMSQLLGPAVAIAALGSIESLLACVVAGRMTGRRLAVNQELVAQGAGNIILPFFGGVPATAAIARISVGVKAGGVTRLVSIIHSVALFAGALFLGGAIARIPLAALAGVLMVTAVRMNEWQVINFYLRRTLKGPTIMMAVSLLLFINQVSRLNVVPTDVDWKRLRSAGFPVSREIAGMNVVYVSGTLFFGAINQFTERIELLPPSQVLILSMRGIPMVDISSVHALEHIWRYQHHHGGHLLVTGLQPQVQAIFERTGLMETIGRDNFFWSADWAILHACNHLVPEPALAIQPDEGAELNEMPLGVVPAD